MPRGKSLVLWLIVYAAVMSGMIGGLVYARQNVLSELDTPEARGQWQQWADETRRDERSNRVVERRAVQGAEPPALVLMRDHFAAVLAVSLLIGSFLFAFMVFMIVGVANQQPIPRGEETE